MARKKTIEVQGKKASLAYITEEEKKLLLARDKAKGSIAEKFHDGIPVLADTDTQETCEAAGGTWENGACTMPEVDETWEKADPYTPIEEPDRIEKPDSETERVEEKFDTGTDFADSVADSLKGEVAGLGAKSAELASLDIDREAQDRQLAAAQQWASKGMSFSTPMLNAEEDMIRDLSRKRLINEDQAIAMQAKLDLGAWNASEPIQKLAAAAKLSATGQPGGFTPGAIDTTEVMDDEFGITLPGFSGLPENISKVFQDYDENPLYPLAENITDPDGNVCDYNDLDEDGYCPIEAQENIMQWLAVGLKFLGLLGGKSANDAAIAIQKAQYALSMAKSADQESVARRQVKRATDEANLLLAKSNLKDQYEAALRDLGDKGSTDAQRIADDFAKIRSDIGVEKFGASGDIQRETQLKFLRDAREQGMLDAVGDEASIAGRFSGAGVAGVPSEWANAYNKSAENIYGEMETRAGLRADLGSTQDMDLLTAMGGTGLERASLGEEAMMQGLGVDYQVAETDLATAMRKKAAKAAQKGHDIDFGYTLPSTISPGIDPALTSKLSSAQSRAQMFSGLGGIASSIADIIG